MKRHIKTNSVIYRAILILLGLFIFMKAFYFYMDPRNKSGIYLREADLKELLSVSNDGYYLLLDQSDSQDQASKEKYGLMNYSIFILNLEEKRLYYIASDM